VLSSYFYGYLSTMFLGGWLAGRFGGKHVIGTGLLISSVATLLIPPAVRLNKYLIILLRVIIGVAAVSLIRHLIVNRMLEYIKYVGGGGGVTYAVAV